jgi:hypothetical protein
MAIPWGEIATGVAAGGALGWRVYDEFKERKLRRSLKLSGNPSRCGEHEVALGRLDERLKHVEEDIKEIKEKIK